MKKLLLLEAKGNAGEDLLDAARALGVEVYVATHEDVYHDYAAEVKQKAAGVVFTDFASPDVALKELADFAQRERVDGVITGWEFFSPIVTRLAAELGLPGHDPDRADACRNKRLMALAFAEHVVPAPRTVVAWTFDTLADQLASSGLDFPLVVKPAENAGSVGVSVVHSRDGMLAAFTAAQAWPNEFPHGVPLETTVLVQEYVDGKEFSIESVVFQGEIRHLAITEKFTTDGAARAELGHTVPADLSADARGTIFATVEQALVSLGFRNGIAHTELKLHCGVAKIIEVGARPPGDHIMKLVEHALGISEARAYIQIALGEKPDLEPRGNDAAAIRFLTPTKPGLFKTVVEMPVSPAVIDSAVYVEPGHKLTCRQDNVGRVGHIIVKHRFPRDVNELAAAFMSRISVEVD